MLTGLLRDELGFSGVIVSDAMDMAGAQAHRRGAEASVGALQAGCDLLCLGTDNTDDELTEIEQAVDQAIRRGSLGADRLVEAAARVLALSDELVAARAATPVPARPDPGWPGDLGPLIAAFDRQPGAERWRTARPEQWSVVRIEAEPNHAAGVVPWGPFAEVARDPDAPVNAAFAARPQFEVTAEQPTARTLPPGDAVLVVGRDLHRHAFARAVVDRLRREHDEVLVVDMGWPSQDRHYADLATFGASALMGRALLAYLG